MPLGVAKTVALRSGPSGPPLPRIDMFYVRHYRERLALRGSRVKVGFEWDFGMFALIIWWRRSEMSDLGSEIGQMSKYRSVTGRITVPNGIQIVQRRKLRR
jgi:hypothetical protein